jgi:hypothetical protein
MQNGEGALLVTNSCKCYLSRFQMSRCYKVYLSFVVGQQETILLKGGVSQKYVVVFVRSENVFAKVVLFLPTLCRSARGRIPI